MYMPMMQLTKSQQKKELKLHIATAVLANGNGLVKPETAWNDAQALIDLADNEFNAKIKDEMRKLREKRAASADPMLGGDDDDDEDFK